MHMNCMSSELAFLFNNTHCESIKLFEDAKYE